MPISYNPGIQDNSGQLFAQNAAPGYAALARGIQDRQEKEERDLKNGQIADSIVKTNPEFLEKMGLTETQFRSLAAPERSARVTGMMTGIGAQQERQRQAAQMQHYAALAAAEKSKTDYYQQMMGQDKAEGQALNTFAQTASPGAEIQGPPQLPQPAPGGALPGLGGSPMPVDEGAAAPGNMGPPQALSWNERAARALATPGLGGRSGTKLMEEFSKYSPKATTPQITELPDGSQAVLYNGQMKVIPPKRPDVRDIVHPATGEVLGRMIGDSAGKETFHPMSQFGLPADTKIRKMKDEDGDPVKNSYEYFDGKKWRPYHPPAENSLAAIFGNYADTSDKPDKATPTEKATGVWDTVKNAIGAGKPAQEVPDAYRVRVFDPKTGTLSK